MKRKLIRQGGGGYTVYLPKEWVETRGLTAGEQIEVNAVNESLIISSGVSGKRSCEIKLVDESDHEIYVKLSHAYRMGFDKVGVFFTSEETGKKIAMCVQNNLLGFEITTKEKKKYVLENITEPTAEKFPVILRRIFLQIKETYNNIKIDLENNKKENEEEVKNIRSLLDKHIFFCRRVISRKMNLEGNGMLLWELLTFLMHIQHAFYYMHEHYVKKENIEDKTMAILNEIEHYFDNYYKAYFEKKEEYLDKNEKIKNKLNEMIFKELQGSNKNKVILSYLREIVRSIQVGGSPIRGLLSEQKII